MKRKYRIWQEEVPNDHSPGSGGAETRRRGFKGGLKGRKHIRYNDFIKFGNGKKKGDKQQSHLGGRLDGFLPFFPFIFRMEEN